ncbi:hypothetical protein POM88_020201 [Heracleum sosnowskyi]|uniref:Uncharacterized protein n=1 Tax=Heracleum sosnowskyi TaxID=360622 RepID=A0AAD8ICD8_9APIA|nr:hypothetical protein POM88_020201 [Heracleum sosnowskyi]
MEIDSYASAVYNQGGTLSCSLRLLSIFGWAFRHWLFSRLNHWNYGWKLPKVFSNISPRFICHSVVEFILMRLASHSTDLNNKSASDSIMRFTRTGKAQQERPPVSGRKMLQSAKMINEITMTESVKFGVYPSICVWCFFWVVRRMQWGLGSSFQNQNGLEKLHGKTEIGSVHKEKLLQYSEQYQTIMFCILTASEEKHYRVLPQQCKQLIQQFSSQSSVALPQVVFKVRGQTLGYHVVISAVYFQQLFNVSYESICFREDESDSIKLQIQKVVYGYLYISLESCDRFVDESLNTLEKSESCKSYGKGDIENTDQIIFLIGSHFNAFSNWILNVTASEHIPSSMGILYAANVMPVNFKILHDPLRIINTLMDDIGGSTIGKAAPMGPEFGWVVLLGAYKKFRGCGDNLEKLVAVTMTKQSETIIDTISVPDEKMT